MVKIDISHSLMGTQATSQSLKATYPKRKKSGLTVQQMQAQGNLHFFESSTKRAELFSGPIISSSA